MTHISKCYKLLGLVALPLMLLACTDKESATTAGQGAQREQGATAREGQGAKEPQLEVSVEPAFVGDTLTQAGSYVKVQVLENKLMIFGTEVNRGGCELKSPQRTSARELTVEGEFVFGDYEKAYTSCRVEDIKEIRVQTARGEMVYKF